MTSRSQQSRAATQSLIFGKPLAEPRDLDTAHAVEPAHRPDAPPGATDCQIADESGQVAGVTEKFSRQCLNSTSDQRQQTPQACPRQETGTPASVSQLPCSSCQLCQLVNKGWLDWRLDVSITCNPVCSSNFSLLTVCVAVPAQQRKKEDLQNVPV